LKASGNEVEAFWPSMFAKALKGQNIEDLLTSISAAPVGAPAAAAPVTAAPAKIGIFLLKH
jgi:ribosomal protein L12E/L44/L45/RPP1/RPP2